MKKVGLKAIAAALALLMTASLSAPAAAKAADNLLVTSAGGNVLVITQDMVDSEGEFVLSGEDFDKVVLPADVTIKNLYVDGCEIGEFTVEGGNNPKVQLWDAQIKNVTVSAANMIDENKAIADFMEAMKNETSKDTDVEAFIKNVRETNERLAKLVPDIRLMGADMESGKQEIGEVTLAGNAKVNFTKGTNPGKVNVAFKSAQEEMNVTIEGYKGDINVEQTTSVDAPFGVLNLRTKKSEIGDVNVITQGNANIVLRSTDSKAANVNFNSSGAGSTVLTLSAPTDNLKVAGSASNATVKVLTSLISADVQGKGINMNVGASASVEKATIGGTGNSVSGTGDLKDCTISDGASATVQVPGSTVAGNNTYQPSIFVPSINVNPNPPVNPNPNPEPEIEWVEVTEHYKNHILWTDATDTVTIDGSKAKIEGSYKSAYFSLPEDMDVSKIKSVKVKARSDRKMAVKLLDVDEVESTRNWEGFKVAYLQGGVTEMTAFEQSFTYDASANKLVKIAFMSLTPNDDNGECLPLNVEVEEVEIVILRDKATLPESGTPTQEPTATPEATDTPTTTAEATDTPTATPEPAATPKPTDTPTQAPAKKPYDSWTENFSDETLMTGVMTSSADMNWASYSYDSTSQVGVVTTKNDWEGLGILLSNKDNGSAATYVVSMKVKKQEGTAEKIYMKHQDGNPVHSEQFDLGNDWVTITSNEISVAAGETVKFIVAPVGGKGTTLTYAVDDIVVERFTDWTQPDFWTSWTEDFSDKALEAGVKTEPVDMNWASYSYDASNQAGVVTAKNDWEGLGILFDNTDNTFSSASFKVSMKVKKQDGTADKIYMKHQNGNPVHSDQFDLGNDWVTITSYDVAVAAGESVKFIVAPVGGSGTTLTYAVDDIIVTRVLQ